MAVKLADITKEAKNKFDKLDRNNDGNLSRDEFCRDDPYDKFSSLSLPKIEKEKAFEVISQRTNRPEERTVGLDYLDLRLLSAYLDRGNKAGRSSNDHETKNEKATPLSRVDQLKKFGLGLDITNGEQVDITMDISTRVVYDETGEEKFDKIISQDIVRVESKNLTPDGFNELYEMSIELLKEPKYNTSRVEDVVELAFEKLVKEFPPGSTKRIWKP